MALYGGKPVIFITAFLLVTFPLIAGASDLSGHIRMEAPYPQPKFFTVKRKPEPGFPDELVSKTLLVSAEGGVQNAVVHLEGNFPGEANRPEGDLTLNQKGYRFEPHVLIVPQGEPFGILNSDPMAHDVRIFDKSRMVHFFQMDAMEGPVKKSVEDAGIFVVRCGLHKWMHAYVVSAPHRFYAVTDENGAFRMTAIPPGDYTLKIWHEKFGEVAVPVSLKESLTDFSYSFPSLISN